MKSDISQKGGVDKSIANDRLGVGWMLAGIGMLSTALAVPLVVFHLDPLGHASKIAEAPSVAPEAVATASTPMQVRAGIRPGERSLGDVLAEGDIIPGVGIGDIQLDDDVRALLKELSEPSSIVYDLTSEGVVEQHIISDPRIKVTLTADPALRGISSVTFAAANCRDVRDDGILADDLPATSDGLSIGSHASRVEALLGPSDQDSRGGHAVPGMRIGYCPETMMIGAIRIERLPPAPLIAEAGPPAAMQPAPAIADRGMTAPALAEASGPGVEARGGSGKLAAAPGVPDLPNSGFLARDRGAEGVVTSPPEQLLAMVGGAYRVGDAFSISPDRQESPVSPRPVEPAGLAAYTPLPGPDAEEVQAAEFADATTFLLTRAEADEAALDLNRRARGEMQVRLRLLGYDPGTPDGVFGPRTRRMIAALQADEALPATGYLDEALKGSLKERTETAYASRQKQIRLARERSKREAMVIAARVPAARRAPECQRGADGTIISNQSFSCDVTVLKESFASLEESLSNLF